MECLAETKEETFQRPLPLLQQLKVNIFGHWDKGNSAKRGN